MSMPCPQDSISPFCHDLTLTFFSSFSAVFLTTAGGDMSGHMTCPGQHTQHSLNISILILVSACKPSRFIYFSFCVCVRVFCLCTCVPCVCQVLENGQKKISDPLELKLRMAARNCVVTGTKHWSPASNPSPLPSWATAPSPEPCCAGSQNYSLLLWYLVLHFVPIA